MPVIPMIDQPWLWYSSDSARVENRGPLITTRRRRVHQRAVDGPRPPTAAAPRPRGQYGSANAMWVTPSTPLR